MMATGVDLSDIDWDGMDRKFAERERALYQQVIEKRDEAAAAALVGIYASGARMSATELQEALEDGSRQVMRKVLERATVPGATATVSPLDYFGVTERTGPKGTMYTALIRLRRGLEIWLTEEDLRTAVTLEHGHESKKRTTSPKNLERQERVEWSRTVGEIEHDIVSYLCNKKFKGADEDEARAYVRESFHWIPWDQPDESVTYPDSW